MRSGSCEGQFPCCRIPFGLTQKKVNPLKSRFSFFYLHDTLTVRPSHKTDLYLWMFGLLLSSASSKPQRSECSALLDLFCKQRWKLSTPAPKNLQKWPLKMKRIWGLSRARQQHDFWNPSAVFKKVFHSRRREDCSFYKRTKISCWLNALQIIWPACCVIWLFTNIHLHFTQMTQVFF